MKKIFVLALLLGAACGLKKEVVEFCSSKASGGSCVCVGDDCCISAGFKCNPGLKCCGTSTCVDDRCSGATDAGAGGGVGGGGVGGGVYDNDGGLYQTEDGGLIVCSAAYPRPTTLNNCCIGDVGTCTFPLGYTCRVPGTMGPGPCCVDHCSDGGLCSCLVSGSCISVGGGGLESVNPTYVCPPGVPGW